MYYFILLFFSSFVQRPAFEQNKQTNKKTNNYKIQVLLVHKSFEAHKHDLFLGLAICSPASLHA